MRLSIPQTDLYPALQSVARSCGTRSSLPVLANILIQATQNTLRLSATNLEIGIVKSIPSQVEEEGDITVPAKILLDVVTSLSGQEVVLDSSEDQLRISTSNFNAAINGISAAEFPSIPLSTEEGFFIETKALQNSLPQITFAAASDDGRPILTGILTQIKNNTLELVATDGFRLAHKTAKLSEKSTTSTLLNYKTLIPKKTFEEVIRLIHEEKSISKQQQEQIIEISTSENHNQMIFKIGQTQLSSRLIEGQFPTWEKIVPTSFESVVIIERTELLKAIKLASVFAKDAANIVKLDVVNTDKEQKVVISSEAKEVGQQKTEIDAQITGNPLTIAFNSKYLQDALLTTDAKNIILNFSGILSATLIKHEGYDGLEYVVMPIRLS